MTLHPELLTGLGRIVVSWAHVETYQAHLLATLLEAEPARMMVVTQNVSGSTISDWLRTALQIPQIQDDKRLAGAPALIEEINATRAERNALIHGLWVEGSEPLTAMVQTIRWDRATVIKDELHTVADLDELAHRIGNLIRELHALLERLKFPFEVSG